MYQKVDLVTSVCLARTVTLEGSNRFTLNLTYGNIFYNHSSSSKIVYVHLEFLSVFIKMTCANGVSNSAKVPAIVASISQNKTRWSLGRTIAPQ